MSSPTTLEIVGRSEPTIDIWKMKLDWIATYGGMSLVNTYLDDILGGDGRGAEADPVRYRAAFIKSVQKQYAGQYGHVLPRDRTRFWSTFACPDET
jgi:hypothetical protein